jgi:hypothetical protein
MRVFMDKIKKIRVNAILITVIEVKKAVIVVKLKNNKWDY